MSTPATPGSVTPCRESRNELAKAEAAAKVSACAEEVRRLVERLGRELMDALEDADARARRDVVRLADADRRSTPLTPRFLPTASPLSPRCPDPGPFFAPCPTRAPEEPGTSCVYQRELPLPDPGLDPAPAPPDVGGLDDAPPPFAARGRSPGRSEASEAGSGETFFGVETFQGVRGKSPGVTIAAAKDGSADDIFRTPSSSKMCFHQSVSSEPSSYCDSVALTRQAQPSFELMDVWVVHESKLSRIQHKMPTAMVEPVSDSSSLRRGEQRLRGRNFRSMSSLKIVVTMISPESHVRLFWDTLGALLLLYDAVMMPLHVFDLPAHVATTVMEWAICLYWFLDVAVTFSTGMYIKNKLVMDRKEVAKRYIKTTLIFDVVLILTTWLSIADVLASEASYTGLLRMVRFLRFSRLVRLLKMRRLLEKFKRRMNSNLLGLGMSVMVDISSIGICNHWLACAWYGIGADGWVMESDEFQTDIAYAYLTALHWAISQFHGAMEVSPMNATERLYAVLVCFGALVVFSYFLGRMSNTMGMLQRLRRERIHQMAMLNTYLFERRIQGELTARVKETIASASKREGAVQESDVAILQQIPKQLLMDIHEQARTPMLSHHNFFSAMCGYHQPAIRQVCHDAMNELTVHNGEIIFAAGDSSPRAFSVIWGSFSYLPGQRTAAHSPGSTRGAIIGHSVNPGEWIAEASLWTIWENCGSLVACGTGFLLTVKAADFSRIMCFYEKAWVAASLYAKRFVTHLNSLSSLSDLVECPKEDEESDEIAAMKTFGQVLSSWGGSLKSYAH